MRGKLIVLPVTLDLGNRTLLTYALIDSSAATKAFIDRSQAEAYKLPMKPLRRPFEIEVIDGRPSKSRQVTHYIKSFIKVNDYYETKLRFFIIQLAYYLIILGIPQLKVYNPYVSFASYTFTFNSKFCRRNCNTPERPIKVKALYDVHARARPEKLPARPEALSRQDITEVSLRACSIYLRRGYSAFSVTINELDR